jgi:hypothetical protein
VPVGAITDFLCDILSIESHSFIRKKSSTVSGYLGGIRNHYTRDITLKCPTTQFQSHCSLEHTKLHQITLTVVTASVPALQTATCLNYREKYKLYCILQTFVYFVNSNRLILFRIITIFAMVTRNITVCHDAQCRTVT